MFLKSKYGSGYNLVVTRERHESMAKDEGRVDGIAKIIYQHVFNSKMSSNCNTELSFVLPSVESKNFAVMLTELDKRKESLGILNIGISITTLEEVFLKY